MKKIICFAVGLLALQLTPVFGQTTSIVTSGVLLNTSNNQPDSKLTKFNLDFPGGTPKELVAAIEKAMSKPLNVIIPDEDADTKLPPLKMDNVDVAQLFAALEQASLKQAAYFTSPRLSSYSVFNGGYGFKTTGTPTDSSIWYFHVDKPVAPPEVPVQKVVRFYPLSRYLNAGLTVDDITTAIQTGWKMSGDDSPPELNYHKETKLLMAYGEPDKLQVIDNVLQALEHTDYKLPVSIDPATGLPLSKEQTPVEKTGAIDPATGLPVAK